MQELAAALRAFVAERDWEQFHTPENLAKSISTLYYRLDQAKRIVRAKLETGAGRAELLLALKLNQLALRQVCWTTHRCTRPGPECGGSFMDKAQLLVAE